MIVIPLICDDGEEIFVYYKPNSTNSKIVLDKVLNYRCEPMMISYSTQGVNEDNGAWKGSYAVVKDKRILIPYFLFFDLELKNSSIL